MQPTPTANRSQHLRVALLTAALAATLVPAALPDARAEEAMRVRYQCLGRFDATEVTALFFNKAPSEVVLLVGREGALRLPQQRAANGARYADGTDIFWIKGDRANWTRGTTMTCQTVPSRVSSDRSSPEPTR